jgi:hypothetical protein
MIAKDPDYEIRHLRKNEIDKLPEYILKVYNKAWANRFENPELSICSGSVDSKTNEANLIIVFYTSDFIRASLSASSFVARDQPDIQVC